MARRSAPFLLAAFAALGCSGGETLTRQAVEAPAGPTYRAVAGVSMGAMGAAFLGARHPDRFDVIGALGGPLDATFFLRKLDRAYLGGFCPVDELEAILAGAAGDPAALDAELACMGPVPPETGTSIPAHEASFARWPFSDGGGTFERNAHGDLLVDLSLAFGSLVSASEGALPPGVPASVLDDDSASCGDPVVQPGVFDAAANPEGRHPAITFCDGEAGILVCRDTGRAVDRCAEPDPEAACAAEGGVETATRNRHAARFREGLGRHEACTPHERPLPVLLAVDVDGDGVRDHGEPIVRHGAEPFEDVGADGCPDEREDGHGGCVEDPARSPYAAGLPDPNRDRFEWRDRPLGTEGNWRRDEGEPFADDGLDGVAHTFDRGERNGRHDLAPGRERLLAHDLRTLWPGWSAADRARIAIWADGGIRDVFDFGVSAAHALAAMRAAAPEESAIYEAPGDFPGAGASLDPFAVEWSRVPRFALHLYGDPQASPEAIAAGDGDHVGTPVEALRRFLLFFGWLSSRWADLPDPPGDLRPMTGRVRELAFRSEALGADRDFAVVLPPGYDAPENAAVRYPVVYFLHGYGMAPGDLLDLHLFLDGAMIAGEVRKMIVVYPSGRCCFRDGAGGRVCTERNAAGEPNDDDPALRRECRRGTFFVDRVGVGPGDGTAYEASFLELVDHVDRTFRTLAGG